MIKSNQRLQGFSKNDQINNNKSFRLKKHKNELQHLQFTGVVEFTEGLSLFSFALILASEKFLLLRSSPSPVISLSSTPTIIRVGVSLAVVLLFVSLTKFSPIPYQNPNILQYC